ncbi:tRNA (adenosine-34) deaminase [Citrifermentans bemidjiense Bem]|uniref:tRNA-specific adenosine deaminase n=1 Tax=Citrifermentans bemidjiense (strain ATCC BAA-1014 / DSM 16622 / JCM 12645 / Bem) TaxID=404380 RepID=B5ECT8_CITBB|nr:tRNA adenosine(34) deaminase TadA [Citrifermentans bemidjiense]ACH40555.1 tRNA (adenosine-34) deaminase [Citrifermentans bemidjiense Bem]
MQRDDHYWMGKAIAQARRAEAIGEVPIGAVIVKDGVIIARGHNLRESNQDPAAHAEMIAIRKAAKKLASWRLTGATLYVTLEPCTMCMGAVILSRLDRVVFGSYDPKGGAAGSLYDLSDDKRLNHSVVLTPGVRGEETSSMLSGFFAELRAKKKSVNKSSPTSENS